MNLLPIPAFSDNYIWLLYDAGQALVVDPGDAAPVLASLRQLDLQLQGILVTHHHADHVGGVAQLRHAPDRKSTPLNSTHPIISFALFCLKKKNIKSNTQSYERAQ